MRDNVVRCRIARATIRDTVIAEIDALPPDAQERVLRYVRSLASPEVRGVPGRTLVRFAGVMTRSEAAEMDRAIARACEGVDAGEW